MSVPREIGTKRYLNDQDFVNVPENITAAAQIRWVNQGPVTGTIAPDSISYAGDGADYISFFGDTIALAAGSAYLITYSFDITTAAPSTSSAFFGSLAGNISYFSTSTTRENFSGSFVEPASIAIQTYRLQGSSITLGGNSFNHVVTVVRL